MKFMRIMSAAALLSILGTSPVRAAEPMKPTGRWAIDFGDAHCVATRRYGPPDKPITLAFKPSPIGDVMQVLVVRAGTSLDVDQYDGTLTVDQSPPVVVSMLGYSSKTSKMRLTTINLPLAAFQPIRRATSLRLRATGEVDAAFALSTMEPVAQMLDGCITGLRKHWHIADEATAIRQSAQSTRKLGSYFSSRDYPSVAVNESASGLVALMLMIDEAGKVASCMVTATSGYASLDAQSCAIITERAKFTPALGVDGKPTRSGTTVRIRWTMP